MINLYGTLVVTECAQDADRMCTGYGQHPAGQSDDQEF